MCSVVSEIHIISDAFSPQGGCSSTLIAYSSVRSIPWEIKSTPLGPNSWQKTCFIMGSSLHRHMGHDRNLLQLFLGSTMDLHVLQGFSCLTVVLAMDCRRVSVPACGTPPYVSSLAFRSAVVSHSWESELHSPFLTATASTWYNFPAF